jgi:hypothetical protein
MTASEPDNKRQPRKRCPSVRLSVSGLGGVRLWPQKRNRGRERLNTLAWLYWPGQSRTDGHPVPRIHPAAERGITTRIKHADHEPDAPALAGVRRPARRPEGCDWSEDDTWHCHDDHRFARAILEDMGGIDVKASLTFFEEHGGRCDCTILLNVDLDPDDPGDGVPLPKAA